MSFVDDVLANKTDPRDIDKYVAQWHDDPSTTLGLHAYLGFTYQQYARWVEKPSDLWIIFKEIRQQRSNL